MIWIQRDGTPIKIKDMTESHIKNCIKMLKRKINEINYEQSCGYQLLSKVNGEMASYAIENQIEIIFDDIACLKTKILKFEKELEGRKNENNSCK